MQQETLAMHQKTWNIGLGPSRGTPNSPKAQMITLGGSLATWTLYFTPSTDVTPSTLQHGNAARPSFLDKNTYCQVWQNTAAGHLTVQHVNVWNA